MLVREVGKALKDKQQSAQDDATRAFHKNRLKNAAKSNAKDRKVHQKKRWTLDGCPVEHEDFLVGVGEDRHEPAF